jgi:hypothetical protein
MTKTVPTIERRYVPQMDACTDALELLLKQRGRLPDKSGPDDAKGSKHDSAKASIHE